MMDLVTLYRVLLLIANEAPANLNSFRKQAGNSTYDSEIFNDII
jgi:hypothetical protein